MGCYRLTYDFEPAMFVESKDEKNYSLDWQVWSEPSTTFDGVGAKVQTQGGPETTFDILHSSVHDSGRWDWFLETSKTPTNTGYKWQQTAVLLTYDTKGNLVDYIGKQRAFETFEYGTLEQYGNPIKYTNQIYTPSTFMLGVIGASIDYNCGNCLSAPSVWDKYWDFVLSPNSTPKNRLNAVSSPHR